MQEGADAHAGAIYSAAAQVVEYTAASTLGDDSLVSYVVGGVSVVIPAAFWTYLHVTSPEINDADELVCAYEDFVESVTLEEAVCPAVADSSSLTYSYDQPPAGASVMLDPLATGVFVTGVLDSVNPDGETAAITWGDGTHTPMQPLGALLVTALPESTPSATETEADADANASASSNADACTTNDE